MKQHLKLSIKGTVQGVCYRYFAIEKANELGICGWVKNCYDGSVSIEAEGEKNQLELFIDFLRQGPSLAYVTDIKTEWSKDLKGFNDFNIRF